jgi:PAS domain S-box-containing protein
MLWVSDCNKLCTYFNDSWLEFTGRSLKEELGNGWAAGVHPEDIDRCLATYTQAFDKRKRFQMEYRLRRYDGEFRTVLDVGVPRLTPDAIFSGYIGSAIDVTEQKLAEAALSGLSRKLMGAQEEERARIARELHDDLCQRLVSVSIQLHVFAESLPATPTRPRVRAEDFSRQIGDIARAVQGISHQLHSIKLEQLGLVSATADLCREVSEQRAVTVHFSHGGVPDDLPKDVALVLFRVLQEALTNAVKYSGARDVNVTLHASWDEIQLDVIDNGTGFEPQAVRGGLGLVSMRERLRLVNGEVVVESQPGRGTSICVRVPLPELNIVAEDHRTRASLLIEP